MGTIVGKWSPLGGTSVCIQLHRIQFIVIIVAYHDSHIACVIKYRLLVSADFCPSIFDKIGDGL